MSERLESQDEQPQDGYEAPSVEPVETQDKPAVVAAGGGSQQG